MDPLLSTILRLALAALLLRAAWHKGRDLPGFGAVLRDYALLPDRAVGVAARGFPAAEVLVAFTLLLPPLAPVAAYAAAALFLVYTAAIGINLARGRRDIDCGCGGPAATRLHPGLLARNGLLIAAALAAALPTTGRAWQVADAFTALAATLVLASLWAAMESLVTLPAARGHTLGGSIHE